MERIKLLKCALQIQTDDVKYIQNAFQNDIQVKNVLSQICFKCYCGDQLINENSNQSWIKIVNFFDGIK